MNIYKLTFNNSLHYVGQTKHSVEHRTDQHIRNLEGGYHKNKKMQAAFEVYGPPAVEHLETISDDEANNREIYWIKYYNSYSNGLNQTRGGDNNSYAGEDSHNALHNFDDYRLIYWMLANTNNTFTDIAKELEVSYAVVQSINYGKAHQYLEKLFPKEALAIKEKHGKRNSLRTEYPAVRSPEGVVYQIENCNEFCRIHELDSPNLRSVFNGKRKSHNGWTLADETLREKLLNKQPKILATVKSPAGEVLQVYNVHEFAEVHSLNKTAFARMLSGNFKHHKGWKLHE